MKLSQNYLLGTYITAFAGAYSFIKQSGGNIETFMSIVNSGPFSPAGGYFPVWADKFEREAWNEKLFSIGGLVKDLTLVKESFEKTGVNSAAVGIFHYDGTFAYRSRGCNSPGTSS